MTARERSIVYSLLALLAVFNFVYFFQATGKHAMADGSNWPDDLGPAEGVVLSGDEPLRLHNEEGRLAWSDNHHARAYSIAFVDVNAVLTKLMDTSGYKEEREALTATLSEEESAWREKFKAFEQEYADVDENNPRFQEGSQQYQQMNTEFNQWRREAQNRVNAMAVEQLERAYREIVVAVNVVADRADIDIVERLTPVDDQLPQGLSGESMLDIRLRPLVRYPEELDITVEVMEEMALPVE